MISVFARLLLILTLFGLVGLYGLSRRNALVWLPGWVRSRLARASIFHNGTRPRHIMFCFVDHFEPRWRNADYESETRRVRKWREQYPKLCAGHRDADGHYPRHTFFYPSEEYRPEHLDALVELCRAGYGEIEIHLHHDNDTEAGLRANLSEFLGRLVDIHDALPRDDASGMPLWSFVHGNWALDNSRPDGRMCGVNNELTILAELGCYADFTLPSAPDVTQTSTVNSLYYASDDPSRPKSHDRGISVKVGGAQSGDLMIIQGPLGLRWKTRGIIPALAIENGDIRLSNAPSAHRIDFWIQQGIHVLGRPEWVFVKVHTHGTQEQDIDAILGQPIDEMFSYLEREYNDGNENILHYVTSREMYNIAKAAEAGRVGDPGQWRDFAIPRPGFRAKGS